MPRRGTRTAVVGLAALAALGGRGAGALTLTAPQELLVPMARWAQAVAAGGVGDAVTSIALAADGDPAGLCYGMAAAAASATPLWAGSAVAAVSCNNCSAALASTPSASAAWFAELMIPRSSVACRGGRCGPLDAVAPQRVLRVVVAADRVAVVVPAATASCACAGFAARALEAALCDGTPYSATFAGVLRPPADGGADCAGPSGHVSATLQRAGAFYPVVRDVVERELNCTLRTSTDAVDGEWLRSADSEDVLSIFDAVLAADPPGSILGFVPRSVLKSAPRSLSALVSEVGIFRDDGSLVHFRKEMALSLRYDEDACGADAVEMLDALRLAGQALSPEGQRAAEQAGLVCLTPAQVAAGQAVVNASITRLEANVVGTAREAAARDAAGGAAARDAAEAHAFAAAGPALIAGSTTLLPLVSLWAEGFSAVEPAFAATLHGGGSSFGAESLCARQAGVGMLSRSWQDSEAVAGVDGAARCAARAAATVGVHRVEAVCAGGRCAVADDVVVEAAAAQDFAPDSALREALAAVDFVEVPVAYDDVTIFVAAEGAAADCIFGHLGGGLSLAQLRWLFSSASDVALAARGVDLAQVASADDGDGVREWSDLHVGCAAGAVRIAGASATHGTYDFAGRALFGEHTFGTNVGEENFRGLVEHGFAECVDFQDARCGYVSSENRPAMVAAVAGEGDAVAFTSRAYVLGNDSVRAVKVSANALGRAPEDALFAVEEDGYPLWRTLHVAVRDDAANWAAVAPLLAHGVFSGACHTASLTAGFEPLRPADIALAFDAICRRARPAGGAHAALCADNAFIADADAIPDAAAAASSSKSKPSGAVLKASLTAILLSLVVVCVFLIVGALHRRACPEKPGAAAKAVRRAPSAADDAATLLFVSTAPLGDTAGGSAARARARERAQLDAICLAVRGAKRIRVTVVHCSLDDVAAAASLGDVLRARLPPQVNWNRLWVHAAGRTLDELAHRPSDMPQKALEAPLNLLCGDGDTVVDVDEGAAAPADDAVDGAAPAADAVGGGAAAADEAVEGAAVAALLQRLRALVSEAAPELFFANSSSSLDFAGSATATTKIGWATACVDEGAVVFAAAFYRALAAGYAAEHAFGAALRVAAAPRAEAVIFKRLESGDAPRTRGTSGGLELLSGDVIAGVFVEARAPSYAFVDPLDARAVDARTGRLRVLAAEAPYVRVADAPRVTKPAPPPGVDDDDSMLLMFLNDVEFQDDCDWFAGGLADEGAHAPPPAPQTRNAHDVDLERSIYNYRYVDPAAPAPEVSTSTSPECASSSYASSPEHDEGTSSPEYDAGDWGRRGPPKRMVSTVTSSGSSRKSEGSYRHLDVDAADDAARSARVALLAHELRRERPSWVACARPAAAFKAETPRACKVEIWNGEGAPPPPDARPHSPPAGVQLLPGILGRAPAAAPPHLYAAAFSAQSPYEAAAVARYYGRAPQPGPIDYHAAPAPLWDAEPAGNAWYRPLYAPAPPQVSQHGLPPPQPRSRPPREAQLLQQQHHSQQMQHQLAQRRQLQHQEQQLRMQQEQQQELQAGLRAQALHYEEGRRRRWRHEEQQYAQRRAAADAADATDAPGYQPLAPPAAGGAAATETRLLVLRAQESAAGGAAAYDVVLPGSAQGCASLYGGPLALGVPKLISYQYDAPPARRGAGAAGAPPPKRRAKRPRDDLVDGAAAETPQSPPTPLMPRTLRLMGEAKVKRLASFGVHTVEELATVDVRDRIFAVSVTTNKRSDLAVKTLARWRDAAASYLRKRHGEAPEGDSRDVSAASRVIHADDVSIDALDDLEEAGGPPAFR